MQSGAGLVKAEAAGATLRRGAAGILRQLLDQLYPPLCLHCETAVAEPHALCGSCFATLRPITPPLCPVLGLPFAYPLGEGAVSAAALAEPPVFDRARAAVLYNPVARKLVSRMKYGDRPELALFCARLMAVAGAALWSDGPVLVPVPLHRWRLVGRRYNQSMELARALGRLTRLEVDPLLVARHRRTDRQVGLSASARQRNVAGAFRAHAETLERLSGRGVVIVDDVMTTGATVAAVTRALRRAGVERIDVMTFARVVAGEDLS